MEEERSFVEQTLGRLHTLYHHAARERMQPRVFVRRQLLASKHNYWKVTERWSVPKTFQNFKACHIRQTKIQHYAVDSILDRKSTRLNSSHTVISYAVFCLKKKNLITF